MLKDLGVSLLKDIIGLLKHHPHFFSANPKEKQVVIENVLGTTYPSVFTDYLMEANEDDFMREAKLALDVFERRAYSDPSNKLLLAVASYLSGEFAQHFDQLSIAFFFDDFQERSKALEQLFPGNTTLMRTLKDLLIRSTYQEVSLQAQDSLVYLKGIPTVVIQAPLELDAETRTRIRAHLVQKHPFSFPEFQVNARLIGGLRVFVGGKVIDESWMGKIQALSTFKK